MWIWLALLYGVIKGVREIVKKKSLVKNTVLEVLFVYTLLSFVFVIPTAPFAGGVSAPLMLAIAVKSFVIFIAWICSFRAINKMPISLYGLLDLSRVLFSTLLGVAFLREVMSGFQIIGFFLVCLGLLLCRYQTQMSGMVRSVAKGLRRKEKGNTRTEKPVVTEHVETKIIFFALLSCLLNGVSGTMDKVLMQQINSTQLQFWYMLFLISYYIIYVLITKTKLALVKALKNGWIWLLSILFVIGDRALFLANQSADSRVTVMTLLKQACCVVTILAGKFIFKEKNIAYKLFCAAIVITGIVVAVL